MNIARAVAGRAMWRCSFPAVQWGRQVSLNTSFCWLATSIFADPEYERLTAQAVEVKRMLSSLMQKVKAVQ